LTWLQTNTVSGGFLSLMPGQLCPDKSVRTKMPAITIQGKKTIQENIPPPPPKGEPDGFEEVWKAKWSRGTAPNPRQLASKAYAAALKRGSSPGDILAGVKARVGVEKEGTPYAPQLVTWLNQERWKDGTGAAVMKPEEVEALRKKFEKRGSGAQRAHGSTCPAEERPAAEGRGMTDAQLLKRLLAEYGQSSEHIKQLIGESRGAGQSQTAEREGLLPLRQPAGGADFR
jgi:hypothetical protein